MRELARLQILVIPDAFMSSVSGFVDMLGVPGDIIAQPLPFEISTVAEAREVRIGPSRLPLRVDASISDCEPADVVIVPSLVIERSPWTTGRYPHVIEWLQRAYARGSLVCSACSGSLLLAETGLLNGRMATSHWAVERTFRRLFPDVDLRPDRALVVSGEGDRLVMSGAAAAWHDLALHLVARYGGPASATAVAKFFMLEWHHHGQAAYRAFSEPLDHGDAAILDAQRALQRAWRAPDALEQMIRSSHLSERNFSRRFRKATGHRPIVYVQLMRIEQAKRHLETSLAPVDEVSAEVGYEDASFFRRVFKRSTGLAPAEYRRRFQPQPQLR